MTDHEARETWWQARRRHLAQRRADRSERRAARAARRGRGSGIAWSAVLMSMGVAAVVSALVVTIGAVGAAAKGPGGPSPRAAALWEARMAASGDTGGNTSGAAGSRDRSSGDRESARASGGASSRGPAKRSSSAPTNRGSANSPARAAANRSGGTGGAQRRPGSAARPPAGGPGGAGGPERPGTIAGLPDPSAAFDMISRLIGSLGGGRPGGPGHGPDGEPGGLPDPDGLLPGMDVLPDVETIARCIGDLGVPLAPGGAEGGERPGWPAPGEGKGPGGLLPVSRVTGQDAVDGAGMLRELIDDVTSTGGITRETIDRLHGRSLALCG